MGNHKDKKPWNPYPLACLKVEGLSACAKTILIYLGVRSNYKGETCVGCRTMMRELVRSEDFVTKGLKELRAKKLVTPSLRNRHQGEADWRTISSSVLPSKADPSTLNSRVDIIPDLQTSTLPAKDDTEASVLPSRDDISPAQHDRTLQIESLPLNLADQLQIPNLPDSKTERVSERVSEYPRVLVKKEKINLISLLEKLYGREGMGVSMKCLDRIVMAHPEFAWNDYNIHTMDTMLRSKQWREVATLADFTYRWESHGPNGLHAQATRDSVNDDGSLEPKIPEPEPVSLPEEETPTPFAAPAAGWAVQCERCKREVTIPPSHATAGWGCDRAKRGCGMDNTLPMDILAQLSLIWAKNRRPQAADAEDDEQFAFEADAD
jgi:hypothetical protein